MIKCVTRLDKRLTDTRDGGMLYRFEVAENYREQAHKMEYCRDGLFLIIGPVDPEKVSDPNKVEQVIEQATKGRVEYEVPGMCDDTGIGLGDYGPIEEDEE